MGDDQDADSRREARRDRRRQKRREALLAAARALLFEEGVEGLTVAAVAARADVSKPSVYYYFASKVELLGGLMLETADLEIAHLIEIMGANEQSVEALVAVLRGKVAFYRDDLASFRLLYLLPQIEELAGIDDQLREIDELQSSLLDLLAAQLEGDQLEGRIHRRIAPRRLVAATWSWARGMLAQLAQAERRGRAQAFGLDAILDEASITLRRACRPTQDDEPDDALTFFMST